MLRCPTPSVRKENPYLASSSCDLFKGKGMLLKVPVDVDLTSVLSGRGQVVVCWTSLRWSWSMSRAGGSHPGVPDRGGYRRAPVSPVATATVKRSHRLGGCGPVVSGTFISRGAGGRPAAPPVGYCPFDPGVPARTGRGAIFPSAPPPGSSTVPVRQASSY